MNSTVNASQCPSRIAIFVTYVPYIRSISNQFVLTHSYSICKTRLHRDVSVNARPLLVMTVEIRGTINDQCEVTKVMGGGGGATLVNQTKRIKHDRTQSIPIIRLQL